MSDVKARVLELKQVVMDLEKRLMASAAELKGIQANCRHNWGPTAYDPIVQEGYTIPGDPPGVGGV